MYDPIVGRYMLDNWEEITGVLKKENDILAADFH